MRRHTTNTGKGKGDDAPDPHDPQGVVPAGAETAELDVAEGHLLDGELYGVSGEFASPEALVEAAQKAYDAGYRRMDAYTPLPVHGLSDAIGFHTTRLPTIVLIGGIIGCIGGFFLQYWAAVIDYPVNIGGRPLNSWPAFIPVTFELTILLAALFAFFGVLALNGLPMPYHPVFNVERFELASRNRFFLCIEAADARFDPDATRRFLEEIGPLGIYAVES